MSPKPARNLASAYFHELVSTPEHSEILHWLNGKYVISPWGTSFAVWRIYSMNSAASQSMEKMDGGETNKLKQ
jgi:hypothetical protein